MTDTIQDLFTVIHALRWVLVLAAFIIFGALYALALGQLAAERAWSRQLEDEAAANRRLHEPVTPAAGPVDLGRIVALPAPSEVRNG